MFSAIICDIKQELSMTGRELSAEQDAVAAYTIEGVVTSKNLPYETAHDLVAQAQTGIEAVQLLIRGTFQGLSTYHSDRARLDSHFRGGVWRVIDQDGLPFSGGVDENILRDENGKLSHPSFVNELVTRGAAVAISTRGAGSRPITVNNIWRLGRSPNGELLPYASVISIDADASNVARPWGNERPRDIVIAEHVIVLPNLELPIVQTS
jgi:hypothetical protein